MMNEQEMQFADPDWKPTGSLPVSQSNVVVHAPTPVAGTGSNSQANPVSSPASLPTYDQGYQGMWSVSQAQLQQPFASRTPYQAYAPRGRSQSRWWVWVIVAILVVFMISGMGMYGAMGRHAAFSGAPPVPEQHKQVYDMQGATELDINDLSGNVVVKAAPGGGSSVIVISDQGGEPNANYQGQNMVLTSDNTITVFVPQNIALKLSGGTNDFEVDDFTGLLTAQTNSGNLSLMNDNLSQGSSLNTNSGTIDQEQGSANNASITSITGEISLDRVNFNGQVAVSTGGNGTITYTGGTLDPRGKYQFTTESGAINLSLPSDTAMHMTVSQKSGNFDSAFPPDTGNALRAEVGIKTGSGDITINKL